MFTFSKKLALGLDLSDFSLKLIRLGKKRGLTLDNFVEADLPFGLVQGGEIKKEKELVNILKGRLKRTVGQSLQSKRVVCNLPEEKVFIRVIQLPLMKKSELGQAVNWEAEAHIPLSLDEVYLDWQIVKEPTREDNHYSVLIAAVPRLLVDSYSRFLKRSGFRPVALEPESVAVVRSLIKAGDLKPTILVDLGASGTNFVIYAASTIRFTSHINISGQLFNQAIMKKLDVDQKKAEQLKIKVGLDKTKEKGKVYEALVPLVEELAGQIKDYIVFYQKRAAHLSGSAGLIERLLLCGGDSLLINLPLFLSQRLGLKVEIGNPLINLPKPVEKHSPVLAALPKKELLTYTTALGLAMRNLEG